jgi:Ni/Fe-hydrogenase subunit HybB-like protein
MTATAPPIASSATRSLLLIASVIGAGTFIYGVTLGDAIRAWQILLVNFLFFAGLAQAGIVLSALFHATSAIWARPLKRVAEATAAFFPVSFVLLLILFLGLPTWAPWASHPIPGREGWLNIPAFIIRESVAFVVLSGLSVAYLYHSLRADIGMLDESGVRPASGFSQRLIEGWRGLRHEQTRSQRRQDFLAPAVLIAYGWVYSLVAFDFVMALDRHWVSTLAGGYFFTGNLLIGVAFLTLVAVWGRDRLRLHDYIGSGQLHDVGKLLFGFCILWAYMLWSQYLVIWYADLPEETAFVARRMSGEWATFTWLAIGLAFVVPFVVLLSRRVKTSTHGLGTVALAALVGMWVERFVLVSPSLWRGDGVPLGIPEVLITGGILSVFGICYTTFLQTFPVLAVSDPRLLKDA